MKYFVITGNVASGKSLVCEMLSNQGISVICADDLSREIMKTNKKCLYKIVKFFGSSVLDKDKNLNRKKISEIVFNDKKKLFRLESIVYPFINNLFNKKVNTQKLLKKKYIVYEFPILFEKKIQKNFNKIILIYAQYNIRLKRLMERDKIAKNDAKKKINAQKSIKETRFFCDFFINNSSNIDATTKKLKIVWHKLTNRNIGL